MNEIRELTEKEFTQLFNDAPLSETRFFRENIKEPYDFIIKNSIEHKGIIIDGNPIYFGAITYNKEFKLYHLWTIVNSNVKEQFTLFKIAKRTIKSWLEKYKELYATMYKGNELNIRWTERLGFRRIFENNNLISFRLSKGG